MAKILLVDDDIAHNEMVCLYLSRENHMVETTTNGADALHILSVSSYDLLILDWNLPDMEGPDICKQYRKSGSAPILMLTGKGTIENREEGLDSGADDYLVKPFSLKELAARVRALLRRPPTYTGTKLTFGGYELDPQNLTVLKQSTEVRLPKREFALLEFLARHPDTIFSAETLITRVWSSDTETTGESVRTTVRAIRKRLNDEAVIETLKGSGYKIGYGG